MTQDASRVRIGEMLRQDALGAWHHAELDGTALTLRILREDLIGRDDARLLFEEEIRRVRRLDHPAFVRVRHVQRKPPRPWMLTDPIGGQSLAERLQAGRALAPSAVRKLADVLLDGFAYLEARRQVHAAPVPARLVQVDGSWRLLTFRDVRAWDELKSLKGRRWPSAPFAPPEQAREHPQPLRPLPYLAWALAGLLRFAGGGGPPRDAEGAAAALPAGFPPELARILAPLQAWQPEARPQGVDAIRRALTGAEPGSASADASPARRAPVPKRRRKL